MNHKIFAVVVLLFIHLMSSAKTLTASGDYTFYGSSNLTLEQAKTIALERAKTQIIAENFGTVVGVNNTTFVTNSGTSSSVSFLSLGESEVKGEWIETIGEPVFDIRYEKNMQVVTVHVKGTIRELSASKIQFDAKVLRNGTDDRYESENFVDGDYLYVSFKSPVEGYVAIYLYDQYGICRLLPMMSQQEGSVKVNADKRTVFFGRVDNVYSEQENRYVQKAVSEYVMTCAQEAEVNRVYIVFSPNKFVRPADNAPSQTDMPAGLSFESFQKWLAKTRKQDVDMSVKVADIIIRKQ